MGNIYESTSTIELKVLWLAVYLPRWFHGTARIGGEKLSSETIFGSPSVLTEAAHEKRRVFGLFPVEVGMARLNTQI